MDLSSYRPAHNRDSYVHIAHDKPDTCESLSVLFRLEGFETQFSTNADDLFGALQKRRPDAVIVCAELGGEDGMRVLSRIKAMRQAIAVFLLRDTPDMSLAVRCVKAGASDVLLSRPLDSELLLRSVTETIRRDVHLRTDDLGRSVIEVNGFSRLTRRERDVLQRIANGQSNKEVGRDLDISPRTVEVHRARIMAKLGAKNAVDLMRIVLTR